MKPRFACDVAALMALWRSLAVPKICQAQKWTFVGGAATIERTDGNGYRRRLRVGFDSFSLLEQWLVEGYRALYISRCGRLWRNFTDMMMLSR